MRRAVAIAIFLAVVAGTLGCANRRPASSLAEEISRDGFSIGRPPNDNWYLNLSDIMQSPEAVVYRRDVPNEAQTFGFFARFFGLNDLPTSDAEFTALWNDGPAKALTPEGVTIRSNVIRPEPRQGHFCFRFAMETIDRTSQKYPSRPFYARATGLACRHPDRPQSALVAAYVERGLSSDFDDALIPEGEQILRSLRIEEDH